MGVIPGRRHALLLTLAAAASATLLAGCVIESASGGGGGGGGGASNSGTRDGADAAVVDSDSTAASCLIGSWQLRNETFEGAMTELLRSSPNAPAEIRSAADITLSGGSFIHFTADGAYSAWQDDFTMTFVLDGQQIDHVQSSHDSARYTADAEMIWVTGFTQHEWHAEMRMGALGTVTLQPDVSMARVEFFDFQAETPAAGRELVDGAAQYECAGDSLTLHADGGMSAGFARSSAGS